MVFNHFAFTFRSVLVSIVERGVCSLAFNGEVKKVFISGWMSFIGWGGTHLGMLNAQLY